MEDMDYPCKKGDLFYWGPSVRYAVHRNAEDPLTMLNVHFDFTLTHRDKRFIPPAVFIQSFDAAKVTELVEFTDLKMFNQPFLVPNYLQGEGPLLMLEEEYRLQKNFSGQWINGMFLSFLAQLARHLTYRKESDSYHHQLADRIIDYIHQNMDKPLTNKEIAEIFSFHPNYLNRLFISYTGTSLHQYILNMKANKAVELLHQTNMPVAGVAAALGFCDISHFSRFFKQKIGCSPSKLR
jgi:AraC-like DNA-binding protein